MGKHRSTLFLYFQILTFNENSKFNNEIYVLLMQPHFAPILKNDSYIWVVLQYWGKNVYLGCFFQIYARVSLTLLFYSWIIPLNIFEEKKCFRGTVLSELYLLGGAVSVSVCTDHGDTNMKYNIKKKKHTTKIPSWNINTFTKNQEKSK